MEFFRKLSEMIEGYDLQIVLQKNGDTIDVSVFPKIREKDDKKLGDKFSKIKPLVLTGTPEELDNGFLEAISAPLTKVNGLFVNSTEFEEQVAEVKEEIAKDAKKESEKKSSSSSKSSAKKPAPKAEKPKTPAEQAAELIKQGDKDFKKKDYEDALSNFEEAKKLTPKDATLSEKIMSCKVKIKAAKDLDQPDEQKAKPAKEKEAEIKEVPIITNPEAIADLHVQNETAKQETDFDKAVEQDSIKVHPVDKEEENAIAHEEQTSEGETVENNGDDW